MPRVRPVIAAIALVAFGAGAIPGCGGDDNAAASGTPLAVVVEPALELCKQAPASDVFGIVDTAIVGDTLRMNVQFFGGCGAHVFRMCWSGEVLRGDSPWVNTFVSHADKGDSCDDTQRADLEFDLTPLRVPGEQKVGIALQDLMLFYRY